MTRGARISGSDSSGIIDLANGYPLACGDRCLLLILILIVFPGQLHLLHLSLCCGGDLRGVTFLFLTLRGSTLECFCIFLSSADVNY